jgi:diguanylate cyclase (GGDEF)-like protein
VNTDSLDTLTQTNLFRNLPIGVFQDLMADCVLLSFEAGHILLEPGEPNHHLYLLLEGELHVRGTRGDTSPLSVVTAGDCVGEVSLVDLRPPSAFVVAATPVRLLMISEPVLLQLMQRSHLLCLNLMRIQADHFRHNLDQLKSSRFTEQRYRQLAETDALTGLHNRAWCNQVMSPLLMQSVNAGQPVSLAMLDVDHFKSVNDQHGHPAGDIVLQSLADLLRRRFRSTDGLARFGGEEFLVLMPGTPLLMAHEVLDAIRLELAAWPIVLPDGQHLFCTVSIGLAQHQGLQPLDELISLADQMLYRAKQAGRNRVMARSPD